LRTQVYFSCRSRRRARTALVAGVAMLLSGCWTAPSADVRPGGKPRVIENRIEVERIADPATVESVDRAGRTLVLSGCGVPLLACRAGRGARNWDDVRAGDRVRVTIREVLTVYVASRDARVAADARVRKLSPAARVLGADPSYRLLTVQYLAGGTETFKIGLHTRMQGIEAGDSVAIRCVKAVRLRVRRRLNGEESSRSHQGASAP
jgi:hypothetical protein